MRAYEIFCTFTDNEKNLTWLDHLENLVRILNKFKPLNTIFNEWHTPAPMPDDFINQLTNIYDEAALKKELVAFEQKNPNRKLQNLPELAQILEKERPINSQLIANLVYANPFNQLNNNEFDSVSGLYVTANKSTFGNQNFSMKFYHIFKTLDDYINFMIAACEIMCTEKKEIDRITFGADNYGMQRIFKHRQPANWMVFYPTKINPKEMQVAAKVIPIKEYGTLIVAVDEVFDVENPKHVDKVNQVEIRLAELGLLKALPEMP